MSDEGWGQYLVGLGEWERRVCDYSDTQTRFSCFIVGMLLRLCERPSVRPDSPFDVMFMTKAVVRVVEQSEELLKLVSANGELNIHRVDLPEIAPDFMPEFCRLDEAVLKLQTANVTLFEFARRSLISMIELLDNNERPASKFDFEFYVSILAEAVSERRALELILSGQGSKLDWGG